MVFPAARRRMAFRDNHPDAAKGTAVILEGHGRVSETLIPDAVGLFRPPASSNL
jgi:hypothetical protein